jgi:rhomboid family GlyGly-CTERM serine protease
MASIPLPVAWSPAARAAQPGENKAARPIPWASLLLSLSAALLWLSPGLTDRTSLDRVAVEGGQLWRLLTGHLTHWSAEHLAWDLLVFASVGLVLELEGERGLFLRCTLISALLISLGVWFLQPEMAIYRGLSGIDCALVTVLATSLLRRVLAAGRLGTAVVVGTVLLAYLLKVGYELVTGQTVFVDIEASGFDPVPLAHVIGGAVGIVCALTNRSSRSRASGSSAAGSGGACRARGPRPTRCRRGEPGRR